MPVFPRDDVRIDARAVGALSTRGALIALTRRLHGYIGWLVGPFLLIAAVSGLLYAASPQVEAWWYAPELTTADAGPAQPLAVQIAAARRLAGANAHLAAVRPAPAAGLTTRVMFAEPGAGASVYRAIFVDPVHATVRGDLPVYGTSGALPWRTAVDQFHRSLWLGNAGRLYSELAASWLWVAALGGLVLWSLRRKRHRPSSTRVQAADWHAWLGPWLLLGLLFLSATGLTWSQYAGERIGELRAAWGWQTPALDTQLPDAPPAVPRAQRADHHGSTIDNPPRPTVEAALFDRVLGMARAQGIDAAAVEIRPPVALGRAWTVTEIGRGWPTQVDAVAIDADSGAVVGARRFADYPLAAKLTRWGIDAHMGVLFGVVNQVLLVITATGLIALIVLGYVMSGLRWRAGASKRPAVTCLQALYMLPRPLAWSIVGLAAALGWALPVLGVSLLILLVIDGLCAISAMRWRRANHV